MVTLGKIGSTIALAACAACGHPNATDRGPAPDALAPIAAAEMLYTSVPEPVGARCPHGGLKTGTGPDLNGNGVLERGEITTVSFTCHTRRRAPRPALAARAR
jgi:hypothetical protein